MANQLMAGLASPHPGQLVRQDVLPELGLSKLVAAKALRNSRYKLCRILNEEAPVTPSIALKLGKAFGNSPKFWLNLQQAYDIAKLAVKETQILSCVPLLEVA